LPSITWKMQAVQFPSDAIDFAYTTPVTIVSGQTSSGAVTLPIAVDPARSFIWMEEDNDLQVNSNTTGNYQAYLEPLGAGTSVTLTAPLNSTGTIKASVQVVQLKSAAVKAIQEFSIDIPTSATSNTATLGSVTTTNAAIFPMGQAQQTGTADSSPARRQARLAETSATVITASRNTAISTASIRVRGVRVELNDGYWSVQKGTIANVISTNAATALAVTNVASAKTFILRMGFTTTSTTVGNEGEWCAFLYPTVVGNNITLLNMTRGSTAANVTTYGWQLVTFA